MTYFFSLPPSGEVAQRADRGLYVILSASEISHRTIALLIVIARHEVPRQSVGIKGGICAANFTHGDRHANARDDILFLLTPSEKANEKVAFLIKKDCSSSFSDRFAVFLYFVVF